MIHRSERRWSPPNPRVALAAAASAVVSVCVTLAFTLPPASAVGQPKAPAMFKLAGATSTTSTTTTSGSTSSTNQLYPFGQPPATPDYQVQPPPQDPSLVPTYTTKTTTRIWGSNPFEEAVSVTQHVWPAVIPENAPGETNNVPDRPWGV
ncbi:MAG: cell wall-binding repeat-containing protein, partial [Acidimicrobiaceae bacterium]|nr:cell wall-binding repeat-containing protein [Acidimicrobiaceae bacterium]